MQFPQPHTYSQKDNHYFYSISPWITLRLRISQGLVVWAFIQPWYSAAGKQTYEYLSMFAWPAEHASKDIAETI